MGVKLGLPGLVSALVVCSADVVPRDALGQPPSLCEPDVVPEVPEPPSGPEPSLVPEPAALRQGMIRIPGGAFLMGHDGPPPGEPNERPVHEVTIGPFWIDRTEVTVGEMRGCMVRAQCTAPLGRGSACTWSRADDRLPASCVSWATADAYCRAVGKRLPTEAEWEFAAGGGQRSRFPWGNAAPRCAVAVTLESDRSGRSCSARGPAPVGTHPRGASIYGVQDMAGNVEEWVADWYADHYPVATSAPGTSPRGPAFGVAHVLRGGSWMSRPQDARTTARSWGSPNEAGPTTGFRCARDEG